MRQLDLDYLNEQVLRDPLVAYCRACRSLVEEAIQLKHHPEQRPTLNVPALTNLKRRMIFGVTTKEVLLAIGGKDSDRGTLDSVELYDPLEGYWQQVASMPVSRSAHAATVMNNIVYVCGGYTHQDCYTYDPMADTWNSSSIARMRRARAHFGLAALDGSLYAVGGEQNAATAKRYHAPLNVWVHIADLPSRLRFCSAAVSRGSLYVAGDGKLFRYNATKDSWIQLADMALYQRTLFPLLAVDDAQTGTPYLYAIGGWDHSAAVASSERYNTLTGQWESFYTGMTQALEGHSGALYGTTNTVYIAGGYNKADGYFRQTGGLTFTPGTNRATWRASPSLNFARHYPAVVSVQVQRPKRDD